MINYGDFRYYYKLIDHQDKVRLNDFDFSQK